ncbi:MAG: ferric reductase-like transmembrane domain-containing protein [Gammaproteobacteria bacterium]|jgi:sulfoxide reductase heme-binding subunit YedZ|nr:ferric reductase-like transmembrane domain-containing protein [Gammaproteobacteria bacterium]|tara:strand:+ start:4604 stop:5188 length:585 start_codon:yes stop_codon:yes gene_type:complete
MKAIVRIILLVSFLPYVLLNFRAFGFLGGLGANPVEAIIHDTGIWGIRFLVLTLTLTPLYHYSKQEVLRKLPKPIGLVAFFYVLNHFLCYAIIDQAGDLGVIVIDIIETPYLIVGWAGFLCLFAVGLASFNSFQEWFNKNRSTISGLVYSAAVLGVWHFYWQEKVISYEAVFHSVLMTLLIVWRLRISTGKSPS